jgi:ferric-dicitrate binding protein FerR (iron transport regulator)
LEKLLLKYIQGDCNDEEKVIIVSWLDSNPENLKEYLALRKLIDLAIWHNEINLQPEYRPKPTVAKKIRLRLIELSKIAAIFCAGVFLTYWLTYSPPKVEPTTAMQIMYVPPGQRAKITLEDGTKVWLNANTTLKFPNRFSADLREVKLDGEAFFEVVSSKARPFVVNTEKYCVKVWGTKFNLSAYSKSDDFETSLIEGSVEVLGKENSENVVLKPKERVANVIGGKMEVSHFEDMNQFLWKKGILYFDNLSFSELIERLELYFDVKIEVRNQHVLAYHCTGKFRTKDGVEHILKVLQLRNKFEYNFDTNRTKITIE